MFSSGHQLPAKWKWNGRHFLVSQVFDPFAGGCQVSCALATSLATLSHFRREAVERLQRAIELDQWDPLAYLQLGKLYEEMQLPWRAGPLYSKVLEMDPGHSVARQRLAAIDDQANRKQGWRWRPYSARSVKQSFRMMKCLSKFHAAVDNC